MKKTTAGLLSWLAICVGGGALVGMVTAGGDSPWYQVLDKPTWTPPGWIFGPVWTLLYMAMALAAWRVWRRGGWTTHAVPLAAFVAQLALNFAWSFIFFSFQLIGWALVDILLLGVTIVVTMRLFAIVDRYAAWLLAPYLGWVMFAAALNAEIYRLLQ
ncbi:MAG: tryptophan-rich sensory protein [Acidobacteria bacterium]|nr:tryptophan-rich sensory protein [Acidobacteriota bacterium]